MAVDARVEAPAPRRPVGSLVAPALGFVLVAIVLAWLGKNLADNPEAFFRVFLIGLSNGALYALVALGYTLVYGILELINFAHGDVFMMGGMIAATFALSVFALGEDPGIGILVVAILVALAAAMLGCGLLNATIERIAYKPLRRAPRLVPLITAIGMSFILQDVGLIWKGSNPVSLPQVLPNDSIFTIGACPDCVTYRWDRLIVLLITVPTLIGLVWLVRYTRPGKAMRATAQDKDAAAMMGINVDRT